MTRITASIATIQILATATVLLTPALANLALTDLALADNVSPVRAHRGVHAFGGAAAGEKLTIRGRCVILEGEPTPISTPCSNVLLKLVAKDAKDGAAETETRTDAKGTFAFAVDKDQWYRLRPGSKTLTLVSPTRMLQGGDSVDVKLKQQE